MLPYPPSPKPGVAENSWLRVLGGVLAFLSILLTLLGFILHQGVADLILAIIVGLFALRVFLLWLGEQPQHHQPIARWSSMDPLRSHLQPPPSTPGQQALHASPSFPSQPLSQLAPEQHRQPTTPMAPAAAALSAPKLPRSIRPQRPPEAPAFPAPPAPPAPGVQPIPPPPPPARWRPPPYAAVPMPSPAPVPRPSQEGNWQGDDGTPWTQQQRGNDHGTA